ncbi:pyridoxal phosphate-dependent aminotransferase [Candidatus Parcubacteria bacterium]|nr:pyridoxal phosphate-dependent aminotransferase [Candidatus Parcubacteria bacterium]
MRLNIVHPGSEELKYEIRDIVKFANKLEQTGLNITWENIGDPVSKGEEVPLWAREIVAEAASEGSASYKYSPTKGMTKAREFLSVARSRETGVNLSAENILFFNGLGDAINKVYTWLNPSARILGPNPAYPTHSSLEGAHGSSAMLTYKLDPLNNWYPDVNEIRYKVRSNPNIAGLLIINPDNPTGMVYPRKILKEFVKIAQEYELFLIADEIYANMAYESSDFVSLASLADGVPTVIMRGLSKEVPWPGSRCGWVEFYNTDTDENFALYAGSIENAKMTEVCSTSLPQTVLPTILSDPRYPKHLSARLARYERRGRRAVEILGSHPSLHVVMPRGAFYLSVTFSEEFILKPLNIPAANPEAQKLLNAELAAIHEADFDKRFCYQLLGATGICVVPLSTGFNSYVPGFRMTLLETNDNKFAETLRTIAAIIPG